MADLLQVIEGADRAYFRESREKRFGMTLSSFRAIGINACLPSGKAWRRSA